MFQDMHSNKDKHSDAKLLISSLGCVSSLATRYDCTLFRNAIRMGAGESGKSSRRGASSASVNDGWIAINRDRWICYQQTKANQFLVHFFNYP